MLTAGALTTLHDGIYYALYNLLPVADQILQYMYRHCLYIGKYSYVLFSLRGYKLLCSLEAFSINGISGKRIVYLRAAKCLLYKMESQGFRGSPAGPIWCQV